MNTPDTPTPRTDGYCSDGWTGDAICVSADFARQLERELTAAKGEIAALQTAREVDFEVFHEIRMKLTVACGDPYKLHPEALGAVLAELALLRKRVEAADGLAFVLGDAVINAIESTGLAFVGMDIRAKRAAYRATEGKK